MLTLNCTSTSSLDDVMQEMIDKVIEMQNQVKRTCHRIVDEGQPIPPVGPWFHELNKMTEPYT